MNALRTGVGGVVLAIALSAAVPVGLAAARIGAVPAVYAQDAAPDTTASGASDGDTGDQTAAPDPSASPDQSQGPAPTNVPPAPAAGVADAHTQIAGGYALIDDGADRRNVPEMLSPLTADFTQVQQDGSVRSLEQLRALATRNFDAGQTGRLQTAQQTTIDDLAVTASQAVVHAHQDTLAEIADAVGNVAVSQGKAAFEDRWVNDGSGWRLQQNHIVSFSHTDRGQPSPAVKTFIDQMHQQVADLAQFDRQVNQSYCIRSPAMARYTEDEAARLCQG